MTALIFYPLSAATIGIRINRGDNDSHRSNLCPLRQILFFIDLGSESTPTRRVWSLLTTSIFLLMVATEVMVAH